MVAVGACFAWLVYRKRHEIVRNIAAPSFAATLLLGATSLAWGFAAAVDVRSIEIVLLPVMALLVAWAALGKYCARQLLIPATLILVPLLPLWLAAPVLKNMTTTAATEILRWLGRPVFVDGYQITLPGGSFLVDDGCVGLNFLTTSFVIGLVVIEVYKPSIRYSTIVILLGSVLALVANWIRVVLVILIGDATNMQSEIVRDHGTLGWLVFLFIVIIPFFAFITVTASRAIGSGPGALLSTSSPMVAADQSLIVIPFAFIALGAGPLATFVTPLIG